jgi:tetratricopeptide (TPR) repeat protein
MDKELLVRLNALDEENKPGEIIAAILEIPEESRDYELTCHLARAFNNAGDYDSAISQLLSIAEAGENDFLWHFRLGYAYYYSDRFEEALDEFMLANTLDAGDEWTESYILWCMTRIDQNESGT